MMEKKPSLDLQQFRGCQTGLAAFVSKNLERLLLHSLANQALVQKDDPQLVADTLKYTDTDSNNLKHIINFITKVQGSETLTISLLDYERLTQYIRWSFDRLQSSIILSGDEKTQAKAAEGKSGIELLKAIRATSQRVQNELFRNILAFNVSATKGTKAALGELMQLFQKDIIPLEQRHNKNFLCFTSDLKDDAELQSAIVESAELCLEDPSLLEEQKPYYKSVIDSPDINSSFDSLEGELLIINLVKLSLKKQRLEELFRDLRKVCLKQNKPLGIFINSLRNRYDTTSKNIPNDSPNLGLLRTMRSIASDLRGQASDPSEIKYFDALSAAGDDIVEKISLSDNPPPSVSLTNARDELLCGVMHKMLRKIGNVPSCNCTKEQARFMATEKHLIKLNRNRNLRVHYKQYDPKTIAQGGDVWLEQDDVKKFYETIIDSRFFKLTYSYVTEEEDFRKIKEQYFTFDDIESLNEMLSSCVQRLSSTINVDSEYESLDQLKDICEQKIDKYWRDADSDLDKKMEAYYTAQKIATGKIAIHKRGDETWRAVSSNHLTADNFGEVLRSKNDHVPKSLLKRLAVRKVARFPVASAEQYRAFYMHNHPDVRERELKYPGFESIPGHPYLGGTPDAVLDINGKKVLLIFYNMRNNKKAAKSKALQNENVPYKLNDEDPKGRSLYHESIGLAKAHGAEECHVVIFGKCECPNGKCIPSSAECLAVVEVDVKAELSKFDTNMAPKLREFYFSVLLPELALPRKAKGFRKEPFADWNQLFPQQNNEQ